MIIYVDNEPVEVLVRGTVLPWINKKIVSAHIFFDGKLRVHYQIEGECVTQTKEQLLKRMGLSEEHEHTWGRWQIQAWLLSEPKRVRRCTTCTVWEVEDI